MNIRGVPRLLLIVLAMFVVGGIFAAFWPGYGAYIMVVLDLLALLVLVVGLVVIRGRRVIHPRT